MGLQGVPQGLVGAASERADELSVASPEFLNVRTNRVWCPRDSDSKMFDGTAALHSLTTNV